MQSVRRLEEGHMDDDKTKGRNKTVTEKKEEKKKRICKHASSEDDNVSSYL